MASSDVTRNWVFWLGLLAFFLFCIAQDVRLLIAFGILYFALMFRVLNFHFHASSQHPPAHELPARELRSLALIDRLYGFLEELFALLASFFFALATYQTPSTPLVWVFLIVSATSFFYVCRRSSHLPSPNQSVPLSEPQPVIKTRKQTLDEEMQSYLTLREKVQSYHTIYVSGRLLPLCLSLLVLSIYLYLNVRIPIPVVPSWLMPFIFTLLVAVLYRVMGLERLPAQAKKCI